MSGATVRGALHRPVFWGSAAVIVAVLAWVHAFLARSFGWFYVLIVNVFLGGSLALGFSRLGRIRMGGADCRPEYSWTAWMPMLFSAGMGIGLVFWGVAEPMRHFTAPPQADPCTPAAARQAMAFAFFHWGLHAWGIYALVAVALAHSVYNLGAALTIRAAFWPWLGPAVDGPAGWCIDVLAIVATLFGVATSLGLGAQQISAGIGHVAGESHWAWGPIMVIVAVTGLATLSVVLGMDHGIKRFSHLNMVLAALLLSAVLVGGPTVFILNGFLQNLGNYFFRLPEMSTWTETYLDTGWQSHWTIFYWAWWIAWSPFVGMFIARISRGRTIREMVLGVLFAPTLLTFFWFAVFGNSALHEELFGGGGIARFSRDHMPLALFELLGRYPWELFTSWLAIICLVIFFVTSSDSGSLVVDMIASGGNPHPPVWQRVFWSLMEGLVAAVLLLQGGLHTLQLATISTGLPFALVVVGMGYALVRSLLVGPRRGSSRT